MVYKERLGDSDEIGQRYLSNLIHIYARAAKANGAKIAMKWKGDSYAPATTLTNDTGEEFDFVLGQPAFADSVYFNCVDDKIIMMKEGQIVDSGTCNELIQKHGRRNLEETFLKIARSKNELE